MQREENTVNLAEMKKIRNAIRLERKELHDVNLETLLEKMMEDQKRANEIARMKRPSSWLTSLLRKEEKTTFNKREFHDATALRYNGI